MTETNFNHKITACYPASKDFLHELKQAALTEMLSDKMKQVLTIDEQRKQIGMPTSRKPMKEDHNVSMVLSEMINVRGDN